MLKNSALRRIIIATLALLIFFIIYLFPSTLDDSINNISYIDSVKSPIYLVDKNNYVSRINILKKGENVLDNIKNVINSLTIDSTNSIYLPNGFSAVIPKNTKLKEIVLSNKILKLNFSKEFLNIEPDKQVQMLEALIFSVLEFDEVDYLLIFVEEEQLTKLKNGMLLPNLLDKNFGINKNYNISSLKNISKTTTYYTASFDDLVYYVPVTNLTNDNSDKVQVIIKNLKSSPIYQTNLTSYLASSVNLQNYEILENTINLNFDNNLIANFHNSSILEEVKYSIYLSLRDTYDIKSVIFEVPNQPISYVNK